MPTPRPDIIARLLEVLAHHDALEEGPEGVYAACDDLVAGEVDAILEELRQYPPVRVAPHHDSPLVERHIEEALDRPSRLLSPGFAGAVLVCAVL